MKFLCVTCGIEGTIALLECGELRGHHKELGLLKALWHKLKGHHVVKAWEFPLDGIRKDYLSKEGGKRS